MAMLHKAARVSVAFHAMVLDKRYGLSSAFAEFVLCLRRDGNDGAPQDRTCK
jgi:hypothetical protein